MAGEVDTDELGDLPWQQLPDGPVPSMIRRVDTFPTTGYGKADRQRQLDAVGLSR
nr:hypothetical protein [uncultured Actinoplanes sp.]